MIDLLTADSAAKSAKSGMLLRTCADIVCCIGVRAHRCYPLLSFKCLSLPCSIRPLEPSSHRSPGRRVERCVRRRLVQPAWPSPQLFA